MTREVSSILELKEAIEAGEAEIISYDDEVVKKLKAIKLIKSLGPIAVGAIVAAIPLIVATGGTAAPPLAGVSYILAPSVAPVFTVATSTIIALAIAMGGVIAIALFTDWEYVEIGSGGIKMKRK